MSVRHDIGLAEALDLVRAHLAPLPGVAVPVEDAGGLVLAADAVARVDSPSLTSSLKDGWAVRSADVASASPEAPVRLCVAGLAVAGGPVSPTLEPGTAVQVMTGAPLPPGADAVLASEFAHRDGDDVLALRDARPGRNVMPRGANVAAGSALARAGELLTPPMTGLLAAAGLQRVVAHPRPRVAIVATGDEVVAPGTPLAPGQLYASNLVTLRSWLRHFGIEASWALARDDAEALRGAVASVAAQVDVLLTSGGAWKSERDLTPRALADMGVRLVFHRVRLGPGKAVAFGVGDGLVAFCLPGGPASNEMAFLQVALPGLLLLSGRPTLAFPRTRAVVEQPVERWGGDPTWTEIAHARLRRRDDGELVAEVVQSPSRLHAQAIADALVIIPEGRQRLEAGERAEVQVLGPAPG
ncbi:MAG: molybdopterin molybdotransferase MoeA [Deltaproteobacteria bacterium]|nr:molybdopterin molybdotransferase MoeA [Deltaproteobacteria bacterium]